MHNPSISVIMPNYNHADYIGEALKTICNQSIRPKEIIIIDDGSIDNSLAVIEQVASHDPVIRPYKNEKNRGIIFSMNRGLELVSGDWIHFAGADDLLLPGIYEKSLNILTQHPHAGLTCTDPTFFDVDTGVTHKHQFQFSDVPRYFSTESFISLLSREVSFSFPTNTALWKRSALLEAGGFKPNLRWHCDWFAVYVIAFRYGFCYIPENLGISRVDTRSYHQAGMRNRSEQRQVLENILTALGSEEYADIRSFFRTPAVFSRFGFPMLALMLNNPNFKTYFSFSLLMTVLALKGKTVLHRWIPLPVKRLFRQMVRRTGAPSVNRTA